MKLESVVEVRSVKEEVQRITMMIVEGPFMQVVGSDGNVNG